MFRSRQETGRHFLLHYYTFFSTSLHPMSYNILNYMNILSKLMEGLINILVYKTDKIVVLVF